MQDRVEEMKLHIDPRVNNDAKNRDGHLGQPCNNCGGYGFTMALKGGRIPCNYCQQTGVQKLTTDDLNVLVFEQGKQINALIKDFEMLKKALLETLQTKGIVIDTDVGKMGYGK